MDEDVRIISFEAPLLLAKVIELFVGELTIKCYDNVISSKRKTLQKSDIAHELSKNEMYDFLIDIVPRELQTEKTI